MKIGIRVAGVIAISSSLMLAASALAAGGFHSGGGFHGGGGRSHGGVHGGFHEGFRGRFGSPVVSFGIWPAYYYYPPYYDDYYGFEPAYDYNAQPPVVYNPPPVNYEPQQPAQTLADNSSQATVQTLTPTTGAQPAPPNVQKQTMTVGEIKALVKSGLSDDVIISKIRSSQAVFHLSTAEIIDLKNSGVSEKVINFMLSTAIQR